MVNRSASASPPPAVMLGLLALWAATFAALVMLSRDLRSFWWLLAGMSIVGAGLTLLPGPHHAAGRRPARPAAPMGATRPPPQQPPRGAHTGASLADSPTPEAKAVLSGALSEVTTVRASRTGHPGMAITTSALSIPKAGNSEAENEDAFAVFADGGRVAVSDGASSAYRAGEWARALCAGFADGRVRVGPEDIAAWLVAQAQAFQPASMSDAGWWDTEAAGRGAFATMVGVEFYASAAGPAWRAVAVGDSVLLQLRPHGDGFVLLAGFPIESGEAFTSTPALVSSTVTSVTQVPMLRFAYGLATTGDRWLAVTDELARWALRAHESGMPIWPLLLSGTAPEIVNAVTDARRQGLVVNDDMTLVRIALA